ncbi:MAG TPA: alkene reductase [Azospira sp.]|nr:alkene reductase [Azospira sp.]
MPTLFDPIQIGAISLANRIAMAPLTRNRATGGVPTAMMADYYRQRASAGLIIAEASPISAMAQGYLDTPGIYTPEQVAAWRQVTDAVHAAGGKIVIQLWHVGRISHSSLLPGGAAPVSSTSRAPAGAKTFTAEGFVDTTPPRALADDEIPGLIADYRHAARCAMEAGFDGVEVHAANTYLLEQFLRDSVNDRSGPYGGSIENRARLVLEVVKAVAETTGPGRTGVRLSPMTTFGGSAPLDSNPQALYGYVVQQLAPLDLAYLHLIEGETGGNRQPAGAPAFDYAALRRAFPGHWIVNNGYSREDALAAVANGSTDLVAFGRPFISNPDLVRRLKDNAPFNELRADKLYGGGAEGYVDYPTLDQAGA